MKLKSVLLNLFLLAGTSLHAESIGYKVYQDSTAKPSKVRISADFEYGANLEPTYFNSMYTPTMFHLNIGTNFKL